MRSDPPFFVILLILASGALWVLETAFQLGGWAAVLIVLAVVFLLIFMRIPSKQSAAHELERSRLVRKRRRILDKTYRDAATQVKKTSIKRTPLLPDVPRFDLEIARRQRLLEEGLAQGAEKESDRRHDRKPRKLQTIDGDAISVLNEQERQKGISRAREALRKKPPE